MANKKIRKMNIGQASHHCTVKKGYTSKTARKDCMSRVMRGKFSGR